MKRVWIVLLAALLAFAPAVSFAQDDLDDVIDTDDDGDSLFEPDEEDFVNGATEANLRLIALGNIAAQRGQRASIREYGRNLAREHTAAQARLNVIAGRAGYVGPDEVSDGDEDTIRYFSTVKSSRFDKDFVRQMIHDHEKDLDDYESALEDDDIGPDLASYIVNTLPEMQQKLNEALVLKRTQTEPAAARRRR